jgi:putative flippase GtrA
MSFALPNSMKKRPVHKLMTALRSMGVGLIATLVDLLTLTLLVHFLSFSPRMASIPALSLGIFAQFFGNKLFAFQDKSPAWARQAFQFLGVEVLGFFANLLLFDILVSHIPWPYQVVRLISTNVVYFGLCLPLWSLIFRPQHAQQVG